MVDSVQTEFDSDLDAIHFLASKGVTLDSNRWMDLKDARVPLGVKAYVAVGYLCDKHGFTVNP